MVDTYRIKAKGWSFPDFLADIDQARARLDKESRLHRGSTLTLERLEPGSGSWTVIEFAHK